MVDPITLSASIAHCEHELGSLSAFLGRTKLHPERCSEQLGYVKRRCEEIGVELGQLRDAALVLERGQQ